RVRDRLLEAGRIDAIDLPGLSAERRSTIAGGVLVLEAAFDALGLERMAVSKAAMREGVLYDMLGRGSGHDPREASIAAITQRYGAYVIEHSDIAGFSRQEQQFLAALVRTHRRKIPKSAFDALPDRLLPSARRTAALLRIAALLHRSRDSEEIPRLDLLVDGPRMVLGLDRRWLHNRPLLRADLEGEPPQIAALGVQLEIAAG